MTPKSETADLIDRLFARFGDDTLICEAIDTIIGAKSAIARLKKQRDECTALAFRAAQPGDTPSADLVGSLSTSSLNPSSLNQSDQS